MIEREVKLSAWPGFRLPDLDGVAPGARTRRRETVDLDATYYDTADLRLGRRGITLRHRRRGVRQTWTLKLPAGGASAPAPGDAGAIVRDEVDVVGPPGAVPDELALLVAADVRTAALVKVARLMTVRRRTVVLAADDTPIAEVDDDEVSVMDGGRVAARFRELEVEVAPDVDDEVARRVVDRLVRAGAEPAGAVPKLARAVGPRFGLPPEATPEPLPPEPTAGDVVTRALREAAGRIVRHHPVVVVGADPEGVHRMRVGVRRLRSHLCTFRPLLDREVTDPVGDELRWLGDVLGAVRDPDVLSEQVRAVAATVLDADDAPVLEGPLRRLAAERDAAVEVLHGVLGSDRYRRLLDQVVALAEAPPLRKAARGDAAEVLPGLVAGPWRDLVDRVDGLGPEPDDAALHRVRTGAEQVRDALDAVVPAVGRPARRAAKRLRRVQTALDDHQDTVVAEEWLRRAADHVGASTDEAFVLGLVAAAERVARRGRRDDWRAAWERAADPDRWEWLG